MLAAVLAVTLIPSDVLPEAYAEPARDASASDAASASDVQTAGDAEAASSDAAAAGSDAEAAAASSAAEAERPAVTSSTEPLSGSPAKADVDRITGTVALGEEDAATLFSFEGLSYSVNADGATATLTGVANTAAEGALCIPSAVADNAGRYTVTNISSSLELRGGGLR